MTVLHHIQHVPLELKFALKVGIVEDLHGDLLSAPLVHIAALDLDIVALGPVREGDLFIDAFAKLG